MPHSQMFMGDPVVVRCGSCTTLLRVALRPSAAAPQAMENNFMMQMRMQAALARQQHEMRMMAMYGGGGGGSQATMHHPGASPMRQFSHMSGGAGGGGGQMMSPHMMNAMAAQGIGPGSMAALLSPRTGPSPIGEVNRARAQREPTKYNIHMRDELRRLKSDQPGLDHKEAWRLATNSWKKASNSPPEPFTMLGSMHDVQHPMASFPLDDGHHPAGLHQGGGGSVNQDAAAPSAVQTSDALVSVRGYYPGTMAGGVKRKAPEGPIPGADDGEVATTAPAAAAAAPAPLSTTASETQGGGTMSPPPAQRPTAAEYRQPQASPAPLPLTPVPVQVQGLQPAASAQWRDLSDQV